MKSTSQERSMSWAFLLSRASQALFVGRWGWLLPAAVLSGTSVQATKFHKVYDDPGGFFSEDQLNQQILATEDSIYAFLDHGDGLLLTRTDLEGNVVWSHLYGGLRDEASTLSGADDGNLIMVSWSIDWLELVVSKVDAVTGDVVWSKRYPGINQAFTATRRGARHVIMGDKTYINASGDYLDKPVAASIRDSDGTVVWAKEYLEGTWEYLDEYHHYITGAAVSQGQITYVGKFHDAVVDPHGPGRRRVSFLTINAADGLVPINAMHTYDLELNAVDYAIETDAPFVWDIARVTDAAGQVDGFAISGTYSLSSSYVSYASDPAVFRVTLDGDPLWAMLYRTTNSYQGFGRTILQNAYFNGDRLDVYTSWEGYENAVETRSTVSGMIHLDASDGLAVGMSVYDVPDADFSGLCMNRDGTGGYVAMAVASMFPNFDSFELLKVGQIGGNVDCHVEHTLESDPLQIDDQIVEIVPADVDVTPVDYDLTWVDRALTVFECVDEATGP